MIMEGVQPYLMRFLRPIAMFFVIANILLAPTLWQAYAAGNQENQSSLTRTSDLSQYKSYEKSLIYHYLLSEIAWSRGKSDIASEAMATAARLSGEKETTIRAYSFAMESSRMDLAIEMAHRLLSLDPDLTRAQVMLLRAYIASDQPAKVFDTLVMLLEQSGSNSDLVIRYVAEALGNVENPDRWLSVMDQLAEHLPDRPEVHLAHGFVAHQAGRLIQADSYLDLALQLKPGWEEAAVLRLSWWNDVGNHGEIRRFAEEFLGDFPDRSRFQLVFARLLLQWGDNDSALPHFLMVIEREPENSDAMFSAGSLYLQKQRYQLAAEMLERYLKLEPNDDRARLYLARIARQEERYQLALEWLSGVFGDQLRFEAQLEKGRIMFDQGQLDDALNHLAGIVPRNPSEQVQIYLTEEQILRAGKRIEQALTLLNAALIDIPDNPDLLYARGLVTAKLKQLVQHERDMRRLIELQPDNAHAYNALGYTLADESVRLDEALVLIKKAVKLRPKDPFILDSLGWVHYRLGNYALAVDNLRKALDIRFDPEIAAHLGEVLWAQGRVDDARDIWKRGLEFQNGTNSSVLDETIRRLDQ